MARALLQPTRSCHCTTMPTKASASFPIVIVATARERPSRTLALARVIGDSTGTTRLADGGNDL